MRSSVLPCERTLQVFDSASRRLRTRQVSEILRLAQYQAEAQTSWSFGYLFDAEPVRPGCGEKAAALHERPYGTEIALRLATEVPTAALAVVEEVVVRCR